MVAHSKIIEDRNAPGKRIRVYAVDDERSALRTLQRLGRRKHFEVHCFDSGPQALAALATDASVDVVVTDLIMPEMTGMELLERVKHRRPEVEVIMTTAHGTLDRAVQAVKLGAYHFLAKPFAELDTPALVITQAAEHKRLLGRARILEGQLRRLEPTLANTLIGKSDGVAQVRRFVEAAAPTPASVLILGESGTGKELVARAIHERSPRRKRPFVAVNCSALAETVLESELFGHVRGAFTGATGTRAGLFQAADGGTLVLDEVGDAPPSVQAKLLRVLQEGEIRPVGASMARRVDVRVVAATNVDLAAAVKRGTFREDLFYRLNVLQVRVPALRHRREDIIPIAYHHLANAATKFGRPIRTMSEDVLVALEDWHWPGNVRELQNAVERAVVLGGSNQIELRDLPEPLCDRTVKTCHRSQPGDQHPRPTRYHAAKSAALKAFEGQYMEAIMSETNGNVSQAAHIAGLDRSNFRRILKRWRSLG